MAMSVIAFAQSPSQEFRAEYELCVEKRSKERQVCNEEEEPNAARCVARVDERLDCDIYVAVLKERDWGFSIDHPTVQYAMRVKRWEDYPHSLPFDYNLLIFPVIQSFMESTGQPQSGVYIRVLGNDPAQSLLDLLSANGVIAFPYSAPTPENEYPMRLEIPLIAPARDREDAWIVEMNYICPMCGHGSEYVVVKDGDRFRVESEQVLWMN